MLKVWRNAALYFNAEWVRKRDRLRAKHIEGDSKVTVKHLKCRDSLTRYLSGSFTPSSRCPPHLSSSTPPHSSLPFPSDEVLQHHAPLAGSVQGVQHLRYCVYFSLTTFHLQDAFQYLHSISLIGQFDVWRPVCDFQVKPIHPYQRHINKTFFSFSFLLNGCSHPKPMIVFLAPKCHQTPSC